jgi:hypothetical protein
MRKTCNIHLLTYTTIFNHKKVLKKVDVIIFLQGILWRTICFGVYARINVSHESVGHKDDRNRVLTQ